MPSFLKKRLQVFVSSTFTDLIEERQAAVEAILRAGHIPAGMELFTAGDESQMEVIKRWIDESDVYLLILGERYGSIEPKSGKSYTYIEYEYAINQSKPLFACVVNDSAIDERLKQKGRNVIEQNNPQKLKEFREFVCAKMVRFWSEPKDIKLCILETLPEFAQREDLRGWTRPVEQVNAVALADEIARLSKENADLKEKLGSSTEETYAGLSFSEMKRVLESIDVYYELIKSHSKLPPQERQNIANLLIFLWENRQDFGTGDYRIPWNLVDGDPELDALQQLTSRGLVQIRVGYYTSNDETLYQLTQVGFIFLNRLEVEMKFAETHSSSAD
jgi:nucleoside 2-deoxyribosyltransferase